jgi:transcriptional regulator with XRE-family HTH domain
VRLGRLLKEARDGQGASIEQLVRRSGLAFDESWFLALEAGRIELDEPLVRWASELYGVDAGEVMPQRSQLVIDLDEGVIAAGARTVSLRGGSTTSLSPSADHVLTNYLALVYLLRDLPPGTPIPLREVDITVLSHALQRNRRDIQSHLARLISTEQGTLEQRSQALRRRVIVPVAGILVGLTAVGGLLLVRANDSDARPEAPPATDAGPTATAKDVPVEIGDAVVADRGEPQRTR